MFRNASSHLRLVAPAAASPLRLSRDREPAKVTGRIPDSAPLRRGFSLRSKSKSPGRRSNKALPQSCALPWRELTIGEPIVRSRPVVGHPSSTYRRGRGGPGGMRAFPGPFAVSAKEKTLTTGGRLSGSLFAGWGLGRGMGRDAHPACRNNAGTRTCVPSSVRRIRMGNFEHQCPSAV